MDPTRESYLFMPAWQKGLFYVLIFASLAWMVKQIIDTRRQWQKGRPAETDNRCLHKVWRYILGQRKVQESRPRDGAPMHLMLFYGFLALFIATSLLALAEYGFIVGLPNFHRGAYYLAYELIFYFMLLVFVIGAGWALVRRWSMVRRQLQAEAARFPGEPAPRLNPLTHEPKDYTGLLLLFALGVTGFLVEAARMKANPQPWDHWAPIGWLYSLILPPFSPAGYLAVWWLHALLVCAFFIILPQLRLRHIVIAVMTAYDAPDRPMGALRTIPMDEVEETGRIGVAEPEQYFRWDLKSLDACMGCGRCTEVCPAYGSGKTLNPKQVVADIHGGLRTGGQVAELVTEEALWACTTCNACVEACPVLIRHVDLIVDARRNLTAEGRLTGPATVTLRQVAGSGSAWGQKPADREAWMQGLNVPLARNTGEFEFLFWVGCAGATDPGAIKTTRAVAELLTMAGVSYACLGREEACTGDPARRIGDEFLFQEKAQGNASVFARYGVKKVVTACPHCFNSLKNEYGEFGAEMEVWHHTQLLAGLVGEGRLKSAEIRPGEVTYHDPCYLARVNNESDAPRRLVGEETNLNSEVPGLIRAVTSPPGPDTERLVEPEHRGRKTLCCGAGGGRMWMEEEPGQRPSERRMAELAATGAKTVAVACPFCRIMLETGRPKTAALEDEIRLVDLAEMLQEANR
ncbi:MAG: 4Fe-4S dicluster domain-containing protein [Fimbriimonadaceae bacterium]|nr:4Fe-4S dicluster domain-containing protein [Fimbriimonadaceae bacterium]